MFIIASVNFIGVGDYKRAERLCMRPEIARFTLTNALLAYSYACSKQNEKAKKLADSIASTNPAEEGVLQALGCTFKALRCEQEYATMYENALNSKGLSDSLVLELFSSYCRLYNPKKMQGLAQRLYKASNSTKVFYLYWSVTCMLLQNLPAAMLVVADKTIHKVLYQLSSQTQPSADETGLYLFILLLQGKFQQALDALNELQSRPAGQLLQDEKHFVDNVNLVHMHRLQLSIHRLDLLLRAGDIDAAIVEARAVLGSYPDQWNVHELLVDAVLLLHGAEPKSDPPAAAPDYTADQHLLVFPQQNLAKFLRELHKAGRFKTETAEPVKEQVLVQHCAFLHGIQKENPKFRSPYLAEMRLLAGAAVQIVNCGGSADEVLPLPAGWEPSPADPNCSFDGGWQMPPQGAGRTATVISELARLLAQYLCRFNGKQCCFSDVKPYFHVLAVLQQEVAGVGGAGGIENHVLVHLRDWAVERRNAAFDSVQQALAVALSANMPASIVDDDVGTALATASSTSNTAKTDAPIADVAKAGSANAGDGDGADDCDDEDDEDAAAGGGSNSKANASAASKKKAKKKKAKKKKAKASGAGSSGGTSESAGGANDESLAAAATVDEHSDVLLKLCCYCKFDQVVSYCDTLLEGAVSVAPSTPILPPIDTADVDVAGMQSRMALYRTSRALFLNGVGGERRNVQPGDELLLQNSSLLRKKARAIALAATASTSTAAATTTTGLEGGMGGATAASYYAIVLRWCRGLLYGKAASPHCFGFNLDLLEPYRALALGECAYAAFGDLGVKHMQVWQN